MRAARRKLRAAASLLQPEPGIRRHAHVGPGAELAALHPAYPAQVLTRSRNNGAALRGAHPPPVSGAPDRHEPADAADAELARPERQGDSRAGGTAGGRDDPGDDGAAAAAVRARPAVHLQHRDGADGDDGRGLHGAAARLRRLPFSDPADDLASAVAERGLHARRSARRPHRRGRGRCGDRIVRPLPDRRQFRGRLDRVRDSRCHQLRGGHQRAPSASPKSARASRSTPCPASRWRSTPT
jgi:hypothetical protein